VEPHRLAEQRSLAYHRLVAERVRRNPELIEQARSRIRGWMRDGLAPHYAHAWERILAGPIDEVCRLIQADTEEGRALRQATPFAGAIDARERWRIWRDVATSAPR
jgi:hypothetical protein